VRSLALAGRLRVDEGWAASMVRATARGVVFILLETPPDERDAGLSDATRDAVISAAVADNPAPEQPSLAPVATTLRALLPGASGLTEGERRLLAEWLDRMVRSAS